MASTLTLAGCSAPAAAASWTRQTCLTTRAAGFSGQFSRVSLPAPGLRHSSFGLAAQQRRPLRQVTRMGLFGLGVPELAVIAGVAALLFGPSKLPELGKGLGKTVKSFQVAAKEFEEELKTAAQGDDTEVGTSEAEEVKKIKFPAQSSDKAGIPPDTMDE